jgi:hypothetical protein
MYCIEHKEPGADGPVGDTYKSLYQIMIHGETYGGEYKVCKRTIN